MTDEIENANHPGPGQEAQTSERIDAVDLARGTAILFMPLVHTLYMYGDRSIFEEATWFAAVMHVVGHGAPMFLFAMGLSFTFSRNQAPVRAAIRGSKLLAIGYATTTVQFVPPLLLGIVPESFIEANGWKAPLGTAQYLHLISEADILHLAGLSLLFMGLLIRWIRSPYVMGSLALAVALLSGVIQGYRPGIVVVDGVCDLLWGDDWNVYFPVVPWAASVVLGMAFGLYIQESGGDTGRAFRLMLRGGAVLAGVGALLWWHDPELHYRDFFHMGPGATLHLMGMTAMGFWLVRRLEKYIKPTRFGRLAIYCSPRVTSLYVTHWILISWGMGIVGFRRHQIPAVVALSVVVLVATLAVEAGCGAAMAGLGRHSIAAVRRWLSRIEVFS